MDPNKQSILQQIYVKISKFESNEQTKELSINTGSSQILLRFKSSYLLKKWSKEIKILQQEQEKENVIATPMAKEVT